MERRPRWYALNGLRFLMVAPIPLAVLLALVVVLFGEIRVSGFGPVVLGLAFMALYAVAVLVVLLSVAVLGVALPSMLGEPDPLGFDQFQRRLLRASGAVTVGSIAISYLGTIDVSFQPLMTAALLGHPLGWLLCGGAVALRTGQVAYRAAIAA